MRHPRYWVRLHDMLDCILEIRKAVEGMSFEAFVESWTLRRALERGVEILSEASRHIPDDVKARHESVPWPDIKVIGNYLRHEYDKIDLDVIWNIARRDIDALEPVVRAMLAEIEAD